MSCTLVRDNQGNLTGVNAKNGEPSLLFEKFKSLGVSNDEAFAFYAQVHTNSFKSWYGDWDNQPGLASKYLDVNGEPILFFHGTNGTFDKFDPSKKRYNAHDIENGMFFSQEYSHAKKYGVNVIPVFLKAQTIDRTEPTPEMLAKPSQLSALRKYESNIINTTKADSVELHTNDKEGIGIKQNVIFNPNNILIVSKSSETTSKKSPLKQQVESSDPLVDADRIISEIESISTMESISNSFEVESQNSLEIVRAVADRLSEKLGVPYSVVSATQAYQITKNAKNPYNGQPAFYYNGVVHFVEGQMNMSTVFHEFSHPFVTALRNENKPLYDKLIAELASTEKGARLLKESAEEYNSDINDPAVTDEALVKSLEESLLDNNTPEFTSLIKKIIYNIRQMLRRVFGKNVTVSKLGLNTSVKDLAKILKSKYVRIEPIEITKADYVAYKRMSIDESNKLAEDLAKNLDNSDVLQMLDAFYTHTSSQLRELKKNKDIKGLNELLATVYGDNPLQKMASVLGKYETITHNNYDEIRSKVESTEALTHERTKAIVSSLEETKTMLEAMVPRLFDLTKQATIELSDLQLAMATYQTIKSYETFVTSVNEILTEQGFPNNSGIMDLLGVIQGKLKSVDSHIKKIQQKGVSSVIIDQSKSLRDELINDRKERIKELKNESANSKVNRDSEIKKLENEIKTIENHAKKIADILANKSKDSNMLSWLTSPMNSQDPLISGYAKLIKLSKSDAALKTQREQNQILEELAPLLEKVRTNRHFDRVDQIGQAITYEATKLFRNEAGELEERKVYAFLDKYKDHKTGLEKLKYEAFQARTKWQETNEESAYREYLDARAALEQHKLNFFQQPYVKEFYAPKKVLLETTETIDGVIYNIGKDAFIKRSEILEKIQEYTDKSEKEEDPSEKQKELDLINVLWKEYRRLYSTVDEYGNKKTGVALAEAKALIKYRNSNNVFYKYTEKEGAFQTALQEYEKFLETSYDLSTDEGKEEYARLREHWISKNTRKSPNDQYFEDLNREYNELSKLFEQAGIKDPKNLEELREIIQGIKTSNKDKNGEVKASEMNDTLITKVKDVDQKILDLRDNIPGISGLTPAESREYSILNSYEEEDLTEENISRLEELNTKKEDNPVPLSIRKAIGKVFKNISNITTREASTDYIDIMNTWIHDIDNGEHLKSTLKTASLSKANADKFLSENIYRYYINQSEEFKEFFERSHISKKIVKDEEIEGISYKNEVTAYLRTSIWSNNVPNNSKYLSNIKILDESGNTIETIPGQPIFEFFTREVKENYKNKRIVGETVDVWGNWLPKAAEDMDTSLEGWDRYINKDYEKMKQSDPDMFRILEILRKAHYKAQEGLEDSAKLGNEIARFRKDKTETLQTKDFTKNELENLKLKLKTVGKQFTAMFKAQKDDIEEAGLNLDDIDPNDLSDVEDVGMFLNLAEQMNPSRSLVIKGTFNIGLDITSLDVIQSTLKYMNSANEQKELIKINPVAQSLVSLVDELNAKESSEISGKKSKRAWGLFNKKGETTRAKVIKALTEREFYGQNVAGWGANNPGLIKALNTMISETSRSYLGLNFPSDIKNRFSQTYHNFINGIAGVDVSPTAMIKGKAFGWQLMTEISKQRYKVGAKSYNFQLLEVFDFMEDRFSSKLGEYATSSATRDVINLTWMTSFRKLMEQEGAFELFGALLINQKVEQTQEDGSISKIELKDAYEIKDGQIQLKDNIVDKEWAIGGRKFNEYKIKMQTILEGTAGTYSKFSQPLVDRNLGWKAFISLRKFAYSMYRRRLNGASVDPEISNYWKALGSTAVTGERKAGGTFDLAYGDMHTGYYAEALVGLAVLYNGLRNGQVNSLTKEEKSALKAVTAELAVIGLLTASMFLLGYDDDDKDRFKKVRNLSGPLPLPWVSDDPNRPSFNMGGWMHAHVIYQLMLVKSENEAFSPSLSGISQMLSFKDNTSVIFGPTVDKLFTLTQDLVRWGIGDERAYYKKDIGPFAWQKAESFKFYNHLLQSFYFRGKAVDPGKGIRDQATFDNLR